jgi:hypothetical protein
VHTPTKLGLDSFKLCLPPRAHRRLSTVSLPLRVLAQLWVNPRKLKVSGLPSSALPVFSRTSAELNQASF